MQLKTLTVKSALAMLAMTSIMAVVPVNQGIDLASIDKSVKPSEDFYLYANGNWIKNNPVPADQPRWGSFDVLQDQNSKKIHDLIKAISADVAAKPGSTNQKIRDFYLAAMDTVAIEKQGYKPLQRELLMLRKNTSREFIWATIANMHKSGAGGFFNFYVYRDLKKSDENVCYLSQGGLGLPDKDYYLKEDEKFVGIRQAYVQHITKMFMLVGIPEDIAAVDANSVLEFEKQLAGVSLSRVELRDEELNYNKFSFEEMANTNTNINWKMFFDTCGVATNYPIIVGQPLFFQKLNELMENPEQQNVVAYVRWNLIRSSAPFLSKAFVNESFAFYGKTLNGTQQQRPRWKRVLGACDEAIGQLVGQAYVKKYSSEASKQKVKAMVANLQAAYKTRIENLDWMSPETKEKALEKLSQFNTKLAYPDKWRDYSKLQIKRDSYLQNMIRANQFDWDYMVSKLGKPVDKTEWQMLPHQVNAYYEPTLNEIVFPAAIMQPPFFYPNADDAVNYGAIGTVIGHEITHGFDDQGSKYDGKGNLNDWWSAEDRARFNEKAAKLIDQFNKYEALPGLNVNGELTIGENIADLGGLSTSFQAYQLSLKGAKAPMIDGMSAEQRFFLAYAQVWRGNFKEEYLRKMVMTNPHAPGNFRAYTVTNLPEFYDAFGVQAGDKMYRDETTRCKIW